MKTVFIFVTSLVAIFGNLPYSEANSCGQVFSELPYQLAKSPHLILFSAPSGGGKTTLAQLLIRAFPHLKLNVSSTTRAPRGTERDGVDYHFLTVSEFKQKIQKNEFAEWAEVHGNFYGTEKSSILNAFDEGKSVLALVDVQGAQKLRKSFKSLKRGALTSIFISPPDLKTLEMRLRGRGTDSEEVIQKRLKNATEEMRHQNEFDFIVINDKLDVALNQLQVLFKTYGLVP